MDYHELNSMTVAQLRELAGGLEGLTGYTQMRKPQLLEAICKHQGIEMHEHHEVVGIDKRAIKAEIVQLKAQRDAARQAGDRLQLKRARAGIHRLKRQLRRATV